MVELYRTQLREPGERLGKEILQNIPYTYVGKPRESTDMKHVDSWYIKSFSITRLAAWVPLALIVTWAILCIVWSWQ